MRGALARKDTNKKAKADRQAEKENTIVCVDHKRKIKN